MNSTVRRFQTYDFLLIVFLVVPLFFLPMAYDVFNFPKLWLLTSLVAGLFVHFLLSMKSVLRLRERRLGFVFALIGFLLISVTVSSALSDSTIPRVLFGYPGRANGVLLYLALVLVLWVAAGMEIDGEFEGRFIKRFVQLITLFTLYALVQLLGLDPISWNNQYNQIIGTLGNPNFSGAFLGIAGIVLLILGVLDKIRRKFFCAGSLFLLALAIATESVQAPAIYAVGLVIFLLSWLYKHAAGLVFSIITTLAISLFTFLFISFLGLGPLGERLYQYTLKLRIAEYWRIGIEISMENPLVGIGPDSYVEGFRRLKGQDFVAEYSQYVTADSAHSGPINFLANFGYPSFLALVSIIGIITVKALRIIFSKLTPNTFLIAIPYIWILGITQSLFSIDQIGLFIFQWICGGLLLNQEIYKLCRGQSRMSGGQRNPNNRFLGHGARGEISLVVVVLVALYGSSFLREEIRLVEIAQQSLSQDADENVVQEVLSHFTDFSKVEVKRAFVISDFLIRSNRLDAAEKLLDKTLESDPDAYEALEQLSRLAKFRGDLQREYTLRSRLKAVDPFNYNNSLALAEVALNLGSVTEGNQLIQEILNLPFDVGLKDSATALLARG